MDYPKEQIEYIKKLIFTGNNDDDIEIWNKNMSKKVVFNEKDDILEETDADTLIDALYSGDVDTFHDFVSIDGNELESSDDIDELMDKDELVVDFIDMELCDCVEIEDNIDAKELFKEYVDFLKKGGRIQGDEKILILFSEQLKSELLHTSWDLVYFEIL